MTEDTEEGGQASLVEARVRILEESAVRAAAGLTDHEARLTRLERLLRVRLHIEKLEERER